MSDKITTTFNGRERVEQAGEAELRLEAVVDLASAFATDCFDFPDGPLDDMLDEVADGLVNFDPSFATLQRLIAENIDDTVHLGQLIYREGLLGLAVKFATPKCEYYNGSESPPSYSWSYYRTGWVYAETYEQAWALGLAWVDAQKARDKAGANL